MIELFESDGEAGAPTNGFPLTCRLLHTTAKPVT